MVSSSLNSGKHYVGTHGQKITIGGGIMSCGRSKVVAVAQMGHSALDDIDSTCKYL